MFGRLKLKYDQYRERRQYEDWLSNGEVVYQQNLKGESNGPHGVFDTLQFRNGLQWHVNDPGSAAYIFQEMFIRGEYDFPELCGAKTILDIGSNIGLFSCFASLKNSNSQIHSFEPDLANYKVLEKNLEQLEASVQLNHAAVASVAGELEFFSAEFGGWSSAFGVLGAENAESYKVPAIVLSDYLQQHCIECIDFMKIDVEGSEYDILIGDDQLWETEIKCLVVEIDRTPRDERYAGVDLHAYLKEKFESIECASPDAPYPVYSCRQSKVAVKH